MNYLLIESLQKFHYFLGDDYKVEYPTDPDRFVTCDEWRPNCRAGLTHIFLRDQYGRRPVYRR